MSDGEEESEGGTAGSAGAVEEETQAGSGGRKRAEAGARSARRDTLGEALINGWKALNGELEMTKVRECSEPSTVKKFINGRSARIEGDWMWRNKVIIWVNIVNLVITSRLQ